MEDKTKVCFDAVYQKECIHLGINESRQPTGIAMSGGGIRSASFGIGILQALDACDVGSWRAADGSSEAKPCQDDRSLLSCFDYLSTVSGGGYAGMALSWFRTQFGDSDKFFPFGKKGSSGMRKHRTDDAANIAKKPPAPEDILDYIRMHGNYLTPSAKFDLVSALGTVIRGALISATFYFACIVLSFVGLLGFINWLAHATSLSAWSPPVDVASTVMWLGRQFYENFQLPQALPKIDEYLFALGIAVSLLSAILFGAVTVLSGPLARAMVALRQLLVRDTGAAQYVLRGTAQWLSGVAVKFIGLGVLMASLPVFHVLLLKLTPTGLLLGMVAVFLRFRTASGKLPLISNFPRAGSIFVGIAAALFIYAVLLLAYACAVAYWDDTIPWPINRFALFFGATALIALSGFAVNLNYNAVGRMYRDRLMEAFMPDRLAIASNRWLPAETADNFPLHQLCGKPASSGEKDAGPQCIRPYHLINTHAVLINDDDMRGRQRGGTSFLLSPLYVGSTETGYTPTATYMTESALWQKSRGMTAATAMAISGAAVNPNTGVGGEGITRNLLVSFLMTFFSIRLGYWGSGLAGRFPIQPNLVYPGIPTLLGLGNKRSSSFIELTDGGHFENLGIYELIRRRCRLIVASDAGADEMFNFSDLGNAVERVRADCGVSIRFSTRSTPGTAYDDTYDLTGLIPGTAGTDVFKTKFELSKRGYAVATINYPENRTGLLILFKATLTPGLPADLYGYKAKHSAFPNQSTADQFFDENQFEAYRELGYSIASTALNDDLIKKIIANSLCPDPATTSSPA